MLEAPIDQLALKRAESTRVLEDHVVALEHDHRQLNRVVELKSAVDAELADFHKNEKFEDSFLISGITRIPQEAVRNVQAVLLILMGGEFNIGVVQNTTS